MGTADQQQPEHDDVAPTQPPGTHDDGGVSDEGGDSDPGAATGEEQAEVNRDRESPS